MPQLAAIEESDEIDALWVLLNTWAAISKLGWALPS
jgi:hypothetical protein